jgi:hypothetical protein
MTDNNRNAPAAGKRRGRFYITCGVISGLGLMTTFVDTPYRPLTGCFFYIGGGLFLVGVTLAIIGICLRKSGARREQITE